MSNNFCLGIVASSGRLSAYFLNSPTLCALKYPPLSKFSKLNSCAYLSYGDTGVTSTFTLPFKFSNTLDGISTNCVYSSPVVGSISVSSNLIPSGVYAVHISSHILAKSSMNLFNPVACLFIGCLLAFCIANIALPDACSGLIPPVAISPEFFNSLVIEIISFTNLLTSVLILAG